MWATLRFKGIHVGRTKIQGASHSCGLVTQPRERVKAREGHHCKD